MERSSLQRSGRLSPFNQPGPASERESSTSRVSVRFSSWPRAVVSCDNNQPPISPTYSGVSSTISSTPEDDSSSDESIISRQSTPQLQLDLQESQRETESLRETILIAQSQIYMMGTALSECQRKLDKKNTKIEHLKQRREETTAENGTLKNQIEALATQKSALENQIEALNAENIRFKAHSNTLQTQKTHFEKQLIQERKASQIRNLENSQELDALKAEMTDLHQELMDAQSHRETIEALQVRLEESQVQQADQLQMIASCRAELEESEGEIRALRDKAKENLELSALITRKDSQIQEQSKQLAEQQIRNQSLSSERDKMAESLMQFSEKLTEQEIQTQLLGRARDNLTKDLKHASEQMAEKETQIQSLTGELQTRTESLDKLFKQEQEKDSKIQSLTTQLKERKETSKQLKDKDIHIQSLNDELEYQRSTLQEQENFNEWLCEKLENKEEEIQRLLSQLNEREKDSQLRSEQWQGQKQSMQQEIDDLKRWLEVARSSTNLTQTLPHTPSPTGQFGADIYEADDFDPYNTGDSDNELRNEPAPPPLPSPSECSVETGERERPNKRTSVQPGAERRIRSESPYSDAPTPELHIQEEPLYDEEILEQPLTPIGAEVTASQVYDSISLKRDWEALRSSIFTEGDRNADFHRQLSQLIAERDEKLDAAGKEKTTSYQFNAIASKLNEQGVSLPCEWTELRPIPDWTSSLVRYCLYRLKLKGAHFLSPKVLEQLRPDAKEYFLACGEFLVSQSKDYSIAGRRNALGRMKTKPMPIPENCVFRTTETCWKSGHALFYHLYSDPEGFEQSTCYESQYYLSMLKVLKPCEQAYSFVAGQYFLLRLKDERNPDQNLSSTDKSTLSMIYRIVSKIKTKDIPLPGEQEEGEEDDTTIWTTQSAIRVLRKQGIVPI